MGIFDRPRQGHHTGRATIIIHVPVWAAGDRPVAFAGTLANRGSFLRIITPLAMAIQFVGTWFALLGPRRPKRDAHYGKNSDVVNWPSRDNATFMWVSALMAGVAISDRAFESTASAIH
jgi:hypothetical protein